MGQAPSVIADLIDRFERNRESYKSPGYNETRLRVEFLDPFFKALCWDVHNELGHADAYKDVIHEDAIRVGGAYTWLLDFHRDWYIKDGPDKHKKELFRTAAGKHRLTTQEKKRILLSNIYGVD